tara:strand:+ start:2032 stop:3165 length:1134 start_codon:yes stop_codon:yes gene_type:complete
MPTPANRAKIQLARGSFTNISASLSDLLDGELCYAKDENKLYMVEGSTLTPVVAEDDDVLVEVHNQSGSDIAKGKPVYVSGTHSSGKPIIALADSNGSGTYPAIGLVHETITNGNDGKVIISGLITDINTSTLGSAGAALYIDSTAGGLTTTRPTAATEKVQKIGLITRSHASNGTILIIGAGRTNDINNELVALTGVSLNAANLGTFTGLTIPDNQDIKNALQALETKAETAIVDADISATAEIAVSKLANGTANQVLVTDGTDVSWSDNLTVAGNLTVSGTTTTINTETLSVEDKNIEIAKVTTPTDVTADGGGITLKGATDKTINWINATDAWTFSEHINIADTKEYRMNGTAVLKYSGSDKILDNVIVDGGTY